MAGYQFFHVECYAREESTKQRTQTKKNSDGTYTSKEVGKDKRGNVRWVIAEAKREQNSCHHINSPQPPLVLLGDLDQVEQEATRWAEEATDERGRKLRKDGACLLAGVISLPRDEEAKWEQFKAKSLDWLKEKYGDNLRCVIAHEKDEAHPHLHFYCVAKKGQKFEDCTKRTARSRTSGLKRAALVFMTQSSQELSLHGSRCDSAGTRSSSARGIRQRLA